ncbi:MULTISPECIES: hypothetical protein [Bacillaceae]|uniref:hypothetical protein n=1 Tax=Bacillaceae TaxID=186817 RepID=UPI0005A610BA|nr:hypothetical protein [Bacillus rubiinfantis]
MSKKIFTKKETSKLLHSETIKHSDLPWLIELLEDKKGLKYSDLDTTQSQLIKEMRSDLLMNSTEEWIVTKVPNSNQLTLDLGQNEQEWKKCQLCGTKNRYIHFIKNKISNVVINVGSECIEEFGDIGRNALKDRRKLVSNQIKNKRLLKLLEIVPKAKSRIEHWNRFLDELDIVLPSNIEDPYIKLGKNAEKVFKSILNKRQSQKEIQLLRNIFLKQEKLGGKIKQYVDSNINQTFVMTKEIDYWLKRNKPSDYSRIKGFVKGTGNGFITSEVLYEINEPIFLEKLAHQYNKNINSNLMRIEKITDSGFVISVYPFFHISLEISNRLFSKKYGSFAFEKRAEFDIEYLLNNSRYYQRSNQENLINEFKIALRNIEMKIETIDAKNKRIDIKCLPLNKYFRFDLEKFIENFKKHLYSNSYSKLQSEILKNNNAFNEKEYKNLIKREKEIKEAYNEDRSKVISR